MKDVITDSASPVMNKTAIDMKVDTTITPPVPSPTTTASPRNSVISDTTPERGLGKKRPSLVFDVDDLELDMALQDEAPAIIKDMNENHQDVLVALSMAFGDHPRCFKETDSAVLTGIDRDGFLLDVTLKTQNGNKEMAAILKDVRVKYQGPVKTVEDMHKEQKSLPQLAFDKLGYKYKVVNGYYTKTIKESIKDTYEVAKASPKLAVDTLHSTIEFAKAEPIKASAFLVGFAAVVGGATFGIKRLRK